jgi:hypothetical protein
MFAAMVPSILLPISPVTPSPRISVSIMVTRLEITLVTHTPS